MKRLTGVAKIACGQRIGQQEDRIPDPSRS
jgi:hypothetical protein